jgi:hypothetical protein
LWVRVMRSSSFSLSFDPVSTLAIFCVVWGECDLVRRVQVKVRGRRQLPAWVLGPLLWIRRHDVIGRTLKSNELVCGWLDTGEQVLLREGTTRPRGTSLSIVGLEEVQQRRDASPPARIHH